MTAQTQWQDLLGNRSNCFRLIRARKYAKHDDIYTICKVQTDKRERVQTQESERIGTLKHVLKEEHVVAAVPGAPWLLEVLMAQSIMKIQNDINEDAIDIQGDACTHRDREAQDAHEIPIKITRATRIIIDFKVPAEGVEGHVAELDVKEVRLLSTTTPVAEDG